MSLLNQNKGKGKQGKKGQKPQAQGSKFIQKPGKAQGSATQKSHKAAGTRGS